MDGLVTPTSHQSGARTRLRSIFRLAVQHLRPSVGVVASVSVAMELWLAGYRPFYSLIFGAGWGLSMLYAVQLRGLKRGDGSVSWTGVLVAAIAFPAISVPLLFNVGALPHILDLTSAPLGIVYFAAKVGCHRIGCCNWGLKRRQAVSLPLLEAWITLALTTVVIIITLSPAPAGIAFAVFLIIHITVWQVAKKFRV